jgi:hypothetical protein
MPNHIVRQIQNFNAKGNVITRNVLKTKDMANAKEGDRTISTSYTVEKCPVKREMCVRGNKEALTISGKWTFLPEKGRIRHYIQGRNVTNSRWKGQVTADAGKHYTHSVMFNGKSTGLFATLYEQLSKNNLLQDASGTPIVNKTWDFELSQCSKSIQGAAKYTSPTMPGVTLYSPNNAECGPKETSGSAAGAAGAAVGGRKATRRRVRSKLTKRRRR